MNVPGARYAFLFTDIEGSMRLWEEHSDVMHGVISLHDALLRSEIESCGGVVFKTVGDAFCASFPSTDAAFGSAKRIQQRLDEAVWGNDISLRVRMAVHSGEAFHYGDDFVGPSLNRIARILAIGNGRQILVSNDAYESLSDSAELVDCGEHKIRDLNQSMRLFLWESLKEGEESQPLRSLSRYPTNLPQQVSSFFGRAKCMVEAKARLRAGRVTTLLGPGGIGKTRLALEVGYATLASFEDGIWFIDLSQLSPQANVLGEIAQVIDVSKAEEGLRERINEACKEKRILLILDNCEHILDGACTAVTSICSGTKNIRFLLTSRAPLMIRGEQAYRLPSLQSTSESGSEAVELFRDRALLAREESMLGVETRDIRELCNRLDGLPLAIELAAARLRSMSFDQLKDRLRDRFRILGGGGRDMLPRQQTLHSTIEWSYDLLTPSEQRLWTRLGIFQGSWMLETAEAVVSFAPIEGYEVVDLMTSLVDKSIVQFDGQGRYRMLESIREFAKSQLASIGETATLVQLVLRHYESSIGKTYVGSVGGVLASEFPRIAQEDANIVAILQMTSEFPEGVESAYALIGLLGRFWMSRGRVREVILSVEALIALPNEGSINRAMAWGSLGMLYYSSGAFPNGLHAMRKSQEIFQQLGDTERAEGLQLNIATLMFATGDYQKAIVVALEAMTAYDGSENSVGLASAHGLLGPIYYAAGDYEKALYHSQLSHQLWSEKANIHAVGVAANNAGHALRKLGRLEESRTRYDESLNIRVEINDFQGLLWSLEGYAKLAVVQEKWLAAGQLLTSARRLRSHLGISPLKHDVDELAEIDRLIRPHIDDCLVESWCNEVIGATTEDIRKMIVRLMG